MDDIYLLYALNQGGWGVFNAMDCPDPGVFPDWMYKKYEVPREDKDRVWKKLDNIKSDWASRGVLPTNGTNIFPELSDLLED